MPRTFALILGVLALMAVGLSPASAQDEPVPGEPPPVAPAPRAHTFALGPAPAAPVAPVHADSGRISLSVDAVGSNIGGGALVEVDKPVGGTVRNAFLVAASTGFTRYEPQVGDVTLNGQNVQWLSSRTMVNGISSVNVFAEVTSIVKPTLDAAPPGLSSLVVAEGGATFSMDGAILAVIFDDPTASIDRAVVLAYGAQQVTGDQIRLVRLPEVPLTDVTATLGVGISFGFQPSGQDSTIDVNNIRLTSSAGGQDDGRSANGALITVGGIGDDPANPPDVFARGSQPGCPRCDDELYDLTSFVTTQNVTLLELTTMNPSADDNFMFAALDVLGASVTWTPSSAIEYVAVGDSTTTGFSVPTCSEDRATSPYGCIGDPPAPPYPERIAAADARFDALERKGIWGYTTADAVAAFNADANTDGPWEPQLVTAQTASALVTVSLGANDMKFSDLQFWLGNCVGVEQRRFLGPRFVPREESCREAAQARATSAALSADLDEMFDILDVAAANGATVVITEYFNPYNDKKVVNNFFDRSCNVIHTIGDIITSAINDELRNRAQAHGFVSVDFKAPFDGHGSGSDDPYVFGSDCETIGAVTAVDFDLGWPPVNTETSQKEIQIRFDPHPNSPGTLAQAEAILEALS